ncbi:hypothetical protein [Pseudomonas mandelii]|uniref:hypothetical protein n=1 Tax=Pseudomonas mandelii TaxID=75612 RepID=UPI00209E878F|nr:hypothetical protein [Pseudomonas mandelii]MCO8310910.1 hypothetical protein [Pseudomonas mandelii]
MAAEFVAHKPDSDLDVAVEIFTLQGDSSPFTTWTCEAQRLKSSIAGVVPVIIDLDWYGGELETPRIHQALEQSSVVVYDVENSTSPIPLADRKSGLGWKEAWTIRLETLGHKSRLPRGFIGPTYKTAQ